MVDQSMIKPLGITFTVLQNSVVDFNYSMLLGRPWLKNAKVTHDWERCDYGSRQWNNQNNIN
jgi:hypothetical protein